MLGIEFCLWKYFFFRILKHLSTVFYHLIVAKSNAILILGPLQKVCFLFPPWKHSAFSISVWWNCTMMCLGESVFICGAEYNWEIQGLDIWVFMNYFFGKFSLSLHLLSKFGLDILVCSYNFISSLLYFLFIFTTHSEYCPWHFHFSSFQALSFVLWMIFLRIIFSFSLVLLR